MHRATKIEVGLMGVTSQMDSSLLSTLNNLHAEFHKKMWYYQKMFLRFKRLNAAFNALALLCIAAGIVVSSVNQESFIMVALTSLSTLIKGWMDFKKLPVKMDACRFAYTTYQKLLIEIQNYTRGVSLDDVENFLTKCQANEETISDLAPPVSVTLIRDYEKTFHHVPVHKRVQAPLTPLILHHAEDKKTQESDSQT